MPQRASCDQALSGDVPQWAEEAVSAVFSVAHCMSRGKLAALWGEADAAKYKLPPPNEKKLPPFPFKPDGPPIQEVEEMASASTAELAHAAWALPTQNLAVSGGQLSVAVSSTSRLEADTYEPSLPTRVSSHFEEQLTARRLNCYTEKEVAKRTLGEESPTTDGYDPYQTLTAECRWRQQRRLEELAVAEARSRQGTPRAEIPIQMPAAPRLRSCEEILSESSGTNRSRPSVSFAERVESYVADRRGF
eukprot:TRINITY_DN110767_c0_g1_i1.p1 TRINITY_DN110767_c0_g1~~TRINITY_DN110767_c0_g1_i1.p1  ORF type:complete len:248 (-),score=34.68 TRINITY_DN110767_c0_g1_i1:94-837(-)